LRKKDNQKLEEINKYFKECQDSKKKKMLKKMNKTVQDLKIEREALKKTQTGEN
jgi:hypothetical protein